jgi:hypothetical protein
MRLEAAVASTLILAYSLYRLIVYSQKLYTRFHYDESDTVNFDDIFSGQHTSFSYAQENNRPISQPANQQPMVVVEQYKCSWWPQLP